MKPNRLAFEERYSDDSGPKYAIRLDNDEYDLEGDKGIVEFERCAYEDFGIIAFPVSKIDWLIECLKKIKEEIEAKE